MMKQVTASADADEEGQTAVTEYQIFCKARIACIAHVSGAYLMYP